MAIGIPVLHLAFIIVSYVLDRRQTAGQGLAADLGRARRSSVDEEMDEMDQLRLSRHPGKQRCRTMYHQMVQANGGSKHATYMCLFKKGGTDSRVQYLLGHVDGDLGSKWECYSKKWFPAYYIMAEKKVFAWPMGFLSMTARSIFYLADVFKDVRFIFILVPLLPQSMPLIGIGILSLLASEALKIIHLSSEPGSAMRRAGYFLLSPIMHLWCNHKEFLLKSKLRDLVSLQDRTRDEKLALKRVREERHSNSTRKGELRATENVIEHSVQIILSMAVLYLKGYGDTLKVSDVKFVYASAAVSLFSIVHGQINLISSQKAGFLGVWAKLLLVIYVLAALIPRGILMFFTLIFGFSLESAPESDSLSYLKVLVIGTTGMVMFLHISVSHVLQTTLCREKGNTLTQALWTLIVPPLFLDWERLNRQENGTLAIPKCWKRTKYVILSHNLLTFCGNMIMSIPLLLSQDFNQHFSDFIPITMSLVIISPIILTSLSLLYFKRCHPWAMLLNADLAEEIVKTSCSGDTNLCRAMSKSDSVLHMSDITNP